MASTTITSVTIRFNDEVVEKSIEEMTKQFYNENKDNVYCPNVNCEARIEFASGPQRTYFRTSRSYIDGEEIVEHMIPTALIQLNMIRRRLIEENTIQAY